MSYEKAYSVQVQVIKKFTNKTRWTTILNIEKRSKLRLVSFNISDSNNILWQELSLTVSNKNWTLERMRKWTERAAASKGWKINPKEDAVRVTIEGLLTNQRIYKRKYCPCRRITRNRVKDTAIICPCIYSDDEIEKNGICLCELFVKR